MTLSELSIRRPVLATVMNLLIIVAGVASWLTLSVRELPDVDNPLVSVSTIYAGASPETVESTLTQPLEEVLNGIEAIRSIESSSAFGLSSITSSSRPAATWTSRPPTCRTRCSARSGRSPTRPSAP